MANDQNTVLSVRNLRKQYPEFLLEDLSFDLLPGTITGLIGRNGAGKTTAINSILSFVHPDSGEVLLRGLPAAEDPQRFRQGIGFVSAGMTYYTRKKLQVITRVTKSFYPAWDVAQYRKYLQAFRLSEDKKPAELSNGMKIKYALALALSHGADLFILDEPTSGLDPVSRDELVEVFLRLKDEGKTILFSTHITSDLEKCADRILFIQNGRLRADDSLDAFRGGYRIVEVQGEVPADLRAAAQGICRVRDGYTVLVSAQANPAESGREATLEEIMIHLEKEAEA